MTGTMARCLAVCWLLGAGFGCAEDAAGSAPEDADAPTPDAESPPACEARWPEPADHDQPHWIAIHDERPKGLGYGDLRVINIADPDSELLSLKPAVETEPASDFFVRWSPDGRWLAFTRLYDAGRELYVVDMTSEVPGVPRLITGSPETPIEISDVSWSPDGHLVYATSDPLVVDQVPPRKLMMAAVDAQPIAQITLSESYVFQTVRWAPDGSQLFLQENAGDRVLVRVDDPTQPVALGHGPEANYLTANWSPDSRYLAIFDDALRTYDTKTDPPEVTVLSEDPEPELSVNALGWSDDTRFLIVQEGTGGAFRVFDMLETPPALVATIDDLAQDSGASRFGSESQPPGFEQLEGFRSSDYGFEPGGHRIVYAVRDLGWVVMDLATAEVASEPVAPLSAELILGFSRDGELLWLDSAGVHATSLDARHDRMLLGSDAFDADGDVVFGDWRSARIAPSGDRFALTGSGSAVQLMMVDDCAALLAAFDYQTLWGGYASSGLEWEWLNDSSGVVQQTARDGDSSSDNRHRLELARATGGRMTVRTLIERTVEEHFAQFSWLEQPRHFR
jgi:WD40 repeat protein